MGTIIAVCISEEKRARKRSVPSAVLIADHGLENDADAGSRYRQVSLLCLERIEEFKKQGALVSYGDFGENLVVSGIDFASLPIGTKLRAGDAVLEISRYGQECRNHCDIYHTMGGCIMPTQGVFARVLHGGTIRPGDEMTVCP